MSIGKLNFEPQYSHWTACFATSLILKVNHPEFKYSWIYAELRSLQCSNLLFPKNTHSHFTVVNKHIKLNNFPLIAQKQLTLQGRVRKIKSNGLLWLHSQIYQLYGSNFYMQKSVVLILVSQQVKYGTIIVASHRNRT